MPATATVATTAAPSGQPMPVKEYIIQVELLRAKGIEVHLISTEVAQLGPDKLDQGPDVAQVARRKVAKTLASFFTGCGPGE